MSSVWLITGSSRGLGRALAEAVLAAGHRLVATARKPSDLAELVEKYGDSVRAVSLDVTDSVSARAAVKEAVDAFGRLDVLVNNAGYGNVASIEEGDEDDFRAQIETNFFGVANVTRAAIPVMRAQQAGHILQISSIGGRAGSPGLSAYQSAKWAVEGFSEVLAKEVKPLGIKVTIVEPGGFRTDWAGSSMSVVQPGEAYRESIGAFLAFRELVKPIGDPKKAALAILKIAGIDEPPLRLLLGTDAVMIASMVNKAQAAGDAQWNDLSLSTDADDADIESLVSLLKKIGSTEEKAA
ncbi:oxidoreductase [Burkholderia sp. PAMC 26561]|uniref:oxidoreductase n=1 Tax=Burkholderia sp. PAMC 26561 TaxID=1795043 RepID=UPI00076B1857|nr:oxidoreductase [Burkholderia sp. PAMC 26561]AME26997.1 oxidoreductase [Burkholderia sp. PAMC 26561]AME27857.1 oxidoreductase [Burkholderia sp. PAMC 26561]